MGPSDEKESTNKVALEGWIKEVKTRHNLQLQNIQLLSTTKHLDEAGFRALDSTLKKVTAFMKKLKNIGTIVSPASLLPELEKLNVSNVCVKVASMYSAFPGILTAELKKQMPYKKNDAISNPSKLRVDLKFVAELVLNGVLQKEGIQLLGSTLSFVVNTDKSEHVNVNIILPLCRSLLFDITNLVPLTQLRLAKMIDADISSYGLSSTVFSDDQRNAVHANEVRTEMNRLHKSIKRQERTRGDASADDRHKFDQAKANYDRLLQNATDLSECLGKELPAMVEEPSDDEQDELAAKKMDLALNEGRLMLWPDADTQLFYEKLSDVRRMGFRVSSESIDEDGAENTDVGNAESNAKFVAQEINESIDNVDVSNLDAHEEVQVDSGAEQSQVDEEDEENVSEEEEEVEISAINEGDSSDDLHKMTSQELSARGHAISSNIKEFLAKLTFCINRELIDNAAIEFMTHFNRKAFRKRLVQHLLNAPTDRLDLLPFYARFLAILKLVIPEVTMQVMHELLSKFRELTRKSIEAPKKFEKKVNLRVDSKIHLCKFISELAKFSIVPKAEALTCLRTLLVDLKSYKVDMLCAMVETMGLFLYRSTESHAKMNIIMEVMRTKSLKVKDPRQQILLDNAYFSVIPPEEKNAPVHHNRLATFRKINWDDEELRGFVLNMLSNPCSVRFEDLDRLASLVGALSDHHRWIGIQVVDDVLEFIRLSLEFNQNSLQQRCLSSVIYLGELFNYNVCGTSIVFKVLYQLITFNIYRGTVLDDLVVSSVRIRLVYDMVNVIGEFFLKGSAKTRMDCFLYYYLRFYYETAEKWTEMESELGEFPKDIKYNVDEHLKNGASRRSFQVEEILQGIRVHQGEDERDESRLKCIMEEEDEDYREEEINQNNRRVGAHPQAEESVSMEREKLYDEVIDDNEETIRVHTDRRILPEDEDFMRDLDRIMNETMQTIPSALKGPMTDLEVPPLARQKFERKITFATESNQSSSKNVNSSSICQKRIAKSNPSRLL
uniref:MIF4G domain-containing protein n=1 Tax=Ditylenchus dipsaci TaxID=166011 RepID=A0A915DDT2_9BILA